MLPTSSWTPFSRDSASANNQVAQRKDLALWQRCTVSANRRESKGGVSRPQAPACRALAVSLVGVLLMAMTRPGIVLRAARSSSIAVNGAITMSLARHERTVDAAAV